MKKAKLRKKLEERATKTKSPETTQGPEVKSLPVGLLQMIQLFEEKAKSPSLVQTIEAKVDQLFDLRQKLAVLTKTQKENYRSNPAIVQKIQLSDLLAREILDLEKQVQKQSAWALKPEVREMCTQTIMTKAIFSGQKKIPAAVHKVTDPSALGHYYRSREEFKKASSHFENSTQPKDRFFFFYSLARHFQSLQPIDAAQAKKNYIAAEKIYEENPQSYSIEDMDEFYADWAKFCHSIGQNEDVKKYTGKGAQLGGKNCQYGYSLCIQKNDPAKSLAWLQQAARQGYIDAKVDETAFKLQNLHSFPPKDKDESKHRTKLVKELQDLSQESPIAKIETAICLIQGKGVKKNIPKAREMLESLINDKDPRIAAEAEFYLGLMSLDDRNFAAGIEHIQRAASNNHAGAQINLAIFHETGWGVEVNSHSAEIFLEKAAKTSQLGYEYYQAFLQRQFEAGVIMQGVYQKKLDQAAVDAQFKDGKLIPIVDPKKNPIHFTKRSFDSATDTSHCNRMDILIKVIAQNPALYADEKIRALFFNIAMAKTLNSGNLARTFFVIGKLFVKAKNTPYHLIQQYITEIDVLIAILREKAHELKASEVASALDGLSKLHLDPQHKSIQNTIEILLIYAQKNTRSFNPIELSMIVSGLIRIGISWTLLSKYLKPFLQEIQKRWEKFDAPTLVHFAYMFATLDIDQSDQQPRLISIKLLNQLFENVQSNLPLVRLKNSSRSQLDLALRYFSKRYKQNQADALPALSGLHKDFKQTGIVKIPSGKSSVFQDQVYLFIKKHNKKAHPEVQVNGLRPDIVIDKLIVGAHGPHHFAYSLSGQADEKTTPKQTPKDRFHDKLYEQAGYRAKYIPYFQWARLRTEEERMNYLCTEEIITAPSV